MSFFSDRSQAWIWIAVVIGVLAIVAIIQFMRANRPEPEGTRPQAPVYTSGTVVEGTVDIAADQFLTYRLNFNKKTKILGTHWTGDSRQRILVLILTEENFEKWKAGLDFKVVTQTGYVPRGKIELVIDPGIYYLVYDNRSKEYGGDKKVEIEFTAN